MEEWTNGVFTLYLWSLVNLKVGQGLQVGLGSKDCCGHGKES